MLMKSSAKGRPSPTFIETGETPRTPLQGGKGQEVVRGAPEWDRRAWQTSSQQGGSTILGHTRPL